VTFSRSVSRALATDFATGVLAFAALFLRVVVLGVAADDDFVGDVLAGVAAVLTAGDDLVDGVLAGVAAILARLPRAFGVDSGSSSETSMALRTA